jgi:hypothetical protein
MEFDPEHLRVAAKVHAKARRQRWLGLAGGAILLLIIAGGVVWAIVALVRAALLMAF